MCKMVYIYDKATLNDISIERLDASTCPNLRKYWIEYPRLVKTDIFFLMKSLLAF